MNAHIQKEEYIEIYVNNIDKIIEDLLKKYIKENLTNDKIEESYLQGIAINLLQNKLNYYKQTLPISWFNVSKN